MGWEEAKIEASSMSSAVAVCNDCGMESCATDIKSAVYSIYYGLNKNSKEIDFSDYMSNIYSAIGRIDRNGFDVTAANLYSETRSLENKLKKLWIGKLI